MEANRIDDLSLRELRKMLRDTVRVAGKNSQGARILRRIVRKREEERPARRQPGGTAR